MTREEIAQRLEDYRAALRSMDPDRWLGLFADDAEVHYPVGGAAHRGEDQIRALFTSLQQRRKCVGMTARASYVAPPNAAAVLWSLHAVQQDGTDQHLQGISTYGFREDGRLSRMMVYRSNDDDSIAQDARATSREQMHRWLQNYWDVLRSMDTDRWVDLYTEDASVQDPVGGPIFTGKAELRTFFDGLKRSINLLDLSPQEIVLAPSQAAVHFAARVVPRKQPEYELRGIVTYAFNEWGKVRQMRAYWSQ